MSDSPKINTTSTLRPYHRSVFARVLGTFKQACDLPDIEVATALLRVLETMISARIAGQEVDQRRDEHRIIGARARLRRLEDRRRDRKLRPVK
jgi:hypothetical protein